MATSTHSSALGSKPASLASVNRARRIKSRMLAVVPVIWAVSTGCQSTDVSPISTTPHPFVPEKDEQKMWEQARRIDLRLAEVELVYNDPKLVAYLQSVLSR